MYEVIFLIETYAEFLDKNENKTNYVCVCMQIHS